MKRAKAARKPSPPDTGATAPEVPGRLSAWLERFGHRRVAYLVASLLLLIPCFWQPRLQAGDLSSHIYNAWLVEQIESGRTEGLMVVGQTTNVLFDLMLGGLYRAVGAEAAQRICVSLAVLIFVWGAFAFVRAVSGGKRWFLLPCIAMLAYGWVFHMGFFNFYLSMGLCFWSLALGWTLRPRYLLAAAVVLAPAYLAHALPVAWAVCLMAFVWATRGMEPRTRTYTSALVLLAIVAVSVTIGHTVFSRWSLSQVKLASGADQVRVFDGKYYVVFFALLLIWGLLFLRMLRGTGARQVASSVQFQFCALSAAGVAILPTVVMIPGYKHTLAFIAERMSLGVAISVCALLGGVRPRAFERRMLVGVAAVFFAFVYGDERALNSVEDRMEHVVAQLAPGQRVLGAVSAPGLRVFPLVHTIDRVCVGRCYSYGNYEASTWQFRVHAVAPNRFSVERYADSWLMEVGAYVVKESDLPLLQVYMTQDGDVKVRTLTAGAQCGTSYWNELPDWLPNV